MLTWDKSEATTHSVVCVGGHKNANEKWNELQDAAQPHAELVAHYQGINKSLDAVSDQIIPVCHTTLVWFDLISILGWLMWWLHAISRAEWLWSEGLDAGTGATSTWTTTGDGRATYGVMNNN